MSFGDGFGMAWGSISDFNDLAVKDFILLVNLSLFWEKFSGLWEEPISFKVISSIDLSEVFLANFIFCISIFNTIDLFFVSLIIVLDVVQLEQARIFNGIARLMV